MRREDIVKRLISVLKILALVFMLGLVGYNLAQAGDWDPKKDDIVAVPFYVADASGQAGGATAMSAAGEATAGDVSQIPMPFGGSIVGISIQVEAARTTGTLYITPTINTVPITTAALTIDDDPTQYNTTTFRRGLHAVTADQRLGVTWDSSADWAAGTTPSVHVTLWYHVEDVD